MAQKKEKLPLKSKVKKLLTTSTTVHKALVDKSCRLCGHELKTQIEEAYVEWAPEVELAVIAGLKTPEGAPDVKALENHMKTVNIVKRRDENWRGFYRQLKNRGLDAVAEGKVSGDALLSAALKAMAQEDKIEGRVQNVQVDNRRQITFIGVPMPGQLSGDVKEALPKPEKDATIEADFILAMPGTVTKEA